MDVEFLNLEPEEGSEENLTQLISLPPMTKQNSKLGINTGDELSLAGSLQNKNFNEDSKAEENSVKMEMVKLQMKVPLTF